MSVGEEGGGDWVSGENLGGHIVLDPAQDNEKITGRCRLG